MKKFSLFLLLVLLGCSSPSTNSIKGIALGMPYHIQIGKPLSTHDKMIVKQIIDSTFAQIDQIANHWNPYSEISLFNNSNSLEAKSISPLLYDLLKLADEIVTLSNGNYDPTLSPIIQLWKTSLQQQKMPCKKMLLNKERHIGWEKVHFTKKTLQKTTPELKLDLDGITKGLAVDHITLQLVHAGYDSVSVEWAGEIRAHGKHPENRPWQIEIYSPSRGPRELVSLENEAIATSGNYRQYWVIPTEDGNRKIFTHLINKNNLRPLELQKDSTLSVTVKAPTCAIADGLATAAMLIDDPQELTEWIAKVKETIPNTSFWIIQRQEF